MGITQTMHHSRSFLQQVDHGFMVVKFLFILYTIRFACAQQRDPTSPLIDPLPETHSLNPSLALIMIAIASALFLLVFFSVYIRQCVDHTHGTTNGLNTFASPIGRWSQRRQQGIEPEVINTFPTFLYSTVKGHKIGKESLECAVCLNEFEDDQTLRLIPKCSHVFHPDCIDTWLASHTTCPVCRANLVPNLAIFEPNNNPYSVEPHQLQNQSNIVNDQTQTDVRIQVSDNNGQHRSELPTQQSMDYILINATNQIPPPRSWSGRWHFGRLFPRSYSTGHSSVQPAVNLDRFTLILPEEVRNRLMSNHLSRAKSCVAFPRVSSSRKGYRSRSGGNWRGRNFFYYDRFIQEEKPDHSNLSSTLPSISKIDSVQFSERIGGSGRLDQPSLRDDGTERKTNVESIDQRKSDHISRPDPGNSQV